jgi:hypothetical protein
MLPRSVVDVVNAVDGCSLYDVLSCCLLLQLDQSNWVLKSIILFTASFPCAGYNYVLKTTAACGMHIIVVVW